MPDERPTRDDVIAAALEIAAANGGVLPYADLDREQDELDKP